MMCGCAVCFECVCLIVVDCVMWYGVLFVLFCACVSNVIVLFGLRLGVICVGGR